jgi:hypothetical protein
VFIPHEFLAAFGDFMLAYSQVEAVLKEVLRKSAGVTRPVGKALFSDMRLRPAIDRIRRINEANGTQIHPKLSEAFEQLAAINDMRDKLIHQGFSCVDDGSFITSNRRLAHVETKVKTLPISIETLADMTDDLTGIHLSFIRWGDASSDRQRQPHIWTELMRALDERQLRPWRYKSPSPASTPGKSRSVPPST